MVEDARIRVFDTNIITKYRDEVPEIVARFDSVPESLRAVAVITLEEQINGWYTQLRRQNTDERILRAYQNLIETVEFYAAIRILPYNQAALTEYRRLSALKTNVGKFDLRIAAIAIAHDAIVVTQNSRDFARIPGAIVESWDDDAA